MKPKPFFVLFALASLVLSSGFALGITGCLGGGCADIEPQAQDIRLEGATCLSAQAVSFACGSPEGALYLTNRCTAEVQLFNAEKLVRQLTEDFNVRESLAWYDPDAPLDDAGSMADGAVGDASAAAGPRRLVFRPGRSMALTTSPDVLESGRYVVHGKVGEVPFSVSWAGRPVYQPQ